jgi:GDP-L-fucose synthase
VPGYVAITADPSARTLHMHMAMAREVVPVDIASESRPQAPPCQAVRPGRKERYAVTSLVRRNRGEAMIEILKTARIYVAGHAGLVGSAILRRLEAEGFANLLTATREELDLRDQGAVDAWFAVHRPEFVFLVAGTVGGILANSTRPAEFIYDNLMIHATVVHAAFRERVRKLLYLGSSCIYPRECPQPMKEEYLLTGPLEPTNEPYAVAKIAGIKLCQSYRRQYGCDFISAMPTNLYGPYDNFDLESSHVLPALVRKFHEARQAGRREVTVWGTGAPRRELLHVDDLADACLFVMCHWDEDIHINVGTGEDLSIRELAELVRDVVHPEATLTWDTTKPDGMPRKLLDVSRLHALGWRHSTGLREGVAGTYRWFVRHAGEET